MGRQHLCCEQRGTRLCIVVSVIIGAAATLEALFEYGVIPSQNQPELRVVGRVNDTSYHLRVLDITTGLGMRSFYMLVACYGLIVLRPLVYKLWHTYHTDDFKPRMKQRRQIILSVPSTRSRRSRRASSRSARNAQRPTLDSHFLILTKLPRH